MAKSIRPVVAGFVLITSTVWSTIIGLTSHWWLGFLAWPGIFLLTCFLLGLFAGILNRKENLYEW